MFENSNVDVEKLPLDIPHMAEPGAISHFDALQAVKPQGLTFNAWATRAGVNRSFFANLRNHDNPNAKSLEKLLETIGVSPAQYDAARHPERRTVRSEVETAAIEDVRLSYDPYGKKPRPVPLLGSALGGEHGDIDEHVELTEMDEGEVLDWLNPTPEMARDPKGYALRVIGDSMSPLFEPGTTVMVSPLQPIGIGDSVVVQLRGGNDHDERVKVVLIKRLVRRSAAFVELQQYNPEMTFRVEARRIAAIHRVASAHY
jgi:phage repressor protein C with HTH and peptisase S24 domain